MKEFNRVISNFDEILYIVSTNYPNHDDLRSGG